MHGREDSGPIAGLFLAFQYPLDALLSGVWVDCTNKSVPYGLPLWDLMSQGEFAGLAFGVLDIVVVRGLSIRQ
jgi:hypothetical protein